MPESGESRRIGNDCLQRQTYEQFSAAEFTLEQKVTLVIEESHLNA